jgi:hypothetical protein
MLRIPHCLDSRLSDGGQVVSLTPHPCVTHHKHFVTSGNNFCQRLSEPQGLVRPEGLCKLNQKKNLFTSSGLEPVTFCFIA